MKPYYQDELITIYNDDCLNHLDVLKQADVLISDPPYGIAWESTGIDDYRERKRLTNKSMTSFTDLYTDMTEVHE